MDLLTTRGELSSPWPDDSVRDLEAETAFLAARLGHPVVQTPGATGLLNPQARSAVWIHSEHTLLPALLAEIEHCRPAPDLMIRLDLPLNAAPLEATGWRPSAYMLRLRHEQPAHVEMQGNRDVQVRPARHDDLPAVRALHDLAFGTNDSHLYLPDDILTVPGLQLLLAVNRRTDLLLGTVAFRARHRGTLLFGLATEPAQQHTGVATRLLADSARCAAHHGSPFLLTDVEPPVPRFWTSLGFRQTSRWCRYNRVLL